MCIRDSRHILPVTYAKLKKSPYIIVTTFKFFREYGLVETAKKIRNKLHIINLPVSNEEKNRSKTVILTLGEQEVFKILKSN